MKVYVIFDSLYERNAGVYSTEERADKVAARLNEQYRTDRSNYNYEVDEFELDAETTADEYEGLIKVGPPGN